MKTRTSKLTSTFIEKNKHAVLLLYFLVYLTGFSYLEKTVTTHFHVIHMALDDYIPFCEYFIIPYLLWFGYVAWGVVYFYFKNKDEYFRLCIALFTGMTVFLIVSYLYPNGHYLRPTTFERDNIFVEMVKQLYSTDTSTNLFPSIHVYNSIVVNFSVWHSENFKEKRAVRYGSALLMTSIILSTMFLKQHSVFDVITGILMAAVIYRLVYGVNAFCLPVRERRTIRHGKKVVAK
ncbi:MAG: phosphatase PAP2 family protein [Roseburia sp.]|nr:phosphatase PAP2 family protein [Roseburia sp.]